MKRIIATAFIMFILCVVAVQTVTARTAGEQNQSQETSTKETEVCEQTGEYGNKKCTNTKETTVKQSQNQKLLDDRNIYIGKVLGSKTHVPVDTALDATATAYILFTAALGLGASVALAKIK